MFTFDAAELKRAFAQERKVKKECPEFYKLFSMMREMAEQAAQITAKEAMDGQSVIVGNDTGSTGKNI